MIESSLWTALYDRTITHPSEGLYHGCFWVQFGHKDGPKLSYETALRLANNYKSPKNKHRARGTNWCLCELKPGGAVANRWKDR